MNNPKTVERDGYTFEVYTDMLNGIRWYWAYVRIWCFEALTEEDAITGLLAMLAGEAV